MLDATEVKMLLAGEQLPAKPVTLKPEEKPPMQQVLKPGPIRGAEKPGLAEGSKPAPA